MLSNTGIAGKFPLGSDSTAPHQEHNYVSKDIGPEERGHLQCWLESGDPGNHRAGALSSLTETASTSRGEIGEYSVGWLLGLLVISREEGKLQGTVTPVFFLITKNKLRYTV